jgi:precorrin-6Y C5,15-methyltransferase (decarboxylating)
MLVIAGNGMGDYTFDNLHTKIDIDKFDKIICDKNFKHDHSKILKFSFKDAKNYILEHYDKENLLYVVTGSPLFFSAGILIAKKLPSDMVEIVDNISSKLYLLQKLIVSDNDVESISLHGRSRIDLSRFLVNKYTFVLCDKSSIQKLKEATKYLKRSDLEVIIGYKLGYKDEIIKNIDFFNSDSYSDFDLTQPYVLLIKRVFIPKNIISLDSEFVTERGMITKKYKRLLSLQNLDLEPNQIFWDVGAGSGSCAIEAHKRYRVKSVLFEKQPQRCEFIRQNLTAHHVCDVDLIEANAQDMFHLLEESPDRVFVGGGGEKVIEKLSYLYERLNSGGIMLINAITLKNLTHMIAVLNASKIVYEVISLSLTTYKGKLDLIEPERQLFQIKVTKK